MRMMRRTRDSEAVEALAITLELAARGRPTPCLLTQASALLRPATASARETAREHTKDRMLRAFDAAADNARSDDAGSRDLPDFEVHTAEVSLAGGGVIRLADVESIDSAKAAEVARVVADHRATSRGLGE